MSRLQVRTVLISAVVMLGAVLFPVAGTASAAQAPMVAARGIPAQGSLNWSGYAVTSSTTRFTYVHSRYVQPAVTCPGVKAQYMSNWVGLDGATNGTVEQTGTQGLCKGPDHTTPVYSAWYEMFPANSVVVFPVAPGDTIDTTVSYAGHVFSLTVADLTSGRSKTFNATCAACKRASAEWIIERPASCKTVDPFTGCQIDALADFGSTTMTQNTAQLAGGSVSGISAFPRIKINMFDPAPGGGFRQLDAVSNLVDQSFTATWIQAGTPVPIQL